MSELEARKLLGKGTFGKVYLVTPLNGDRYIEKEIMYTKETKDMLNREIKVLQYIQDKCTDYLVCYISHEIKNNSFFIRMEYIPNSYELFSFIEKYFSSITFDMKIFTMYRLLQGLTFLHSHNIVHRDIKETNILIDIEKGKLHYIDFGASCLRDDTDCINTEMGTLRCTAPELFESKQNTFDSLEKADVWALGIVFFSIVFGYDFWYEEKEMKLVTNSVEIINFIQTMTQEYIDDKLDRSFELGDFDKKHKLVLKTILSSMLVIDLPERFYAEEVLLIKK